MNTCSRYIYYVSAQHIANLESIPETETDGEVTRINIAVPTELHTEVKSAASRQRLKLREFVIKALESAISHQEA